MPITKVVPHHHHHHHHHHYHNPSHKKNSQWMFLLTTSSMWSCGRGQLLQLRIVWEFLLTIPPTNFSTSQSISLQHSYHSDTVFYIEKRNTYTVNKKSVFFSFIEDEDIKYSFALEKRALYALAYLRGR